jgi:hypothetical protein
MPTEHDVERVRGALRQIEPDARVSQLTDDEIASIARAALSAMPDPVAEIVAWLRNRNRRKPHHYEFIADAIERDEYKESSHAEG